MLYFQTVTNIEAIVNMCNQLKLKYKDRNCNRLADVGNNYADQVFFTCVC